jgi:hypothetical protein
MDMTWADPHRLHRTGKLFIDSGRAADPEEARTILEGMVLQVDVGSGIESVPASQAALLTIINTGHRAFLGGVHVRIDDDPVLTAGWARGQRLSEMVSRFGGQFVDTHADDHPTLVVAEPVRSPTGKAILHVVTDGWCGGVIESTAARPHGGGITMAGVVAGGLGVSEVFQHCLGSTLAARRDVGVSLWRPELSWRDPDATGPPLRWLPRSAWLLGLGHLGQAYAWSLGWLPYARPSDATAYLMDVDTIIEGNLATGLLVRLDDVQKRKTRVVAERLEALGLRTALVERLFDQTLRPVRDEPGLAFAGFHDPAPRRMLGGDRFGRVIDGGLGGEPVGYLDIQLHTFPSRLDPATAFGTDVQTGPPDLLPAYETEALRRIAAGESAGDARCGMLEFAGITVAAAFVGAVASALVLADPLRVLQGGNDYAVIGLDLRSPCDIQCAPNSAPGEYIPPATDAHI